MFMINNATFPRSIMWSLEIEELYLYQHAIAGIERDNSMRVIVEEGKVFASYPFARYATDEIFKHTYMPMGKMQEVKNVFSEK